MSTDDIHVRDRGLSSLSHTGPSGAKMVDVSAKEDTLRRAVAAGHVVMRAETLDLVLRDEVAKGSVVETARIAGIMAAKKTSDLIPLCHPLPLTNVSVELEPMKDPPRIEVTATARCFAKTGVEMEALTAASVACLTIYDMCKAVDREMTIGNIRLLEKSGGRSGYYRRGEGIPVVQPAQGEVVALSISKKKGEKKTNVERASFLLDRGIAGDAHAGPWHRQVSLLAEESIATIKDRGLAVNPGDFAENVTVRGISLVTLPIGTHIQLGKTVLLEVTQIGKQCHTRCEIFEQVGDCVMPREGIFAKVVQPGEVFPGDEVVIR